MPTKMNSSMLIDRNGNFSRNIEENLNLATVFSPVSVVSIIGGQSSGKSTLLNHVFGTKFEEMDAKRGRFQTTKGIWVAKTSSHRGCTLVIDTEGSDDKEREGDENFEKQTALFALAISNIVIVNMMCTDLGRDKGAGWPLLRTAVEVMLRRFSTPRETTLLFVLRDKTDSPFVALKDQLMGELNKIWKELTGSQPHGNAALSHKLKVTVKATSHFLHKKEDFLREVDDLRQWIISYTSGERVTDRTATSGFAEYAESIWDEIKQDKDLNLPNYRVMVAEVRCNLTAKEKYECFRKDESWLQIKKGVESSAVVQGLGKTVDSLIDNYLSQYNEEAQYYAEIKRTEISKQLIENLLKVVEPIYLSEVEKRRNAILKNFEEAAVQELKSSGELEVTKLSKFINEFRNQLKDAAIKQANWNHPTEQLTQLESEIMRCIKWIGIINEHLDQKKQPRQEFWSAVAKVGIKVLIVAASVAAAVKFIQTLASPDEIVSTLQNLVNIAKAASCDEIVLTVQNLVNIAKTGSLDEILSALLKLLPTLLVYIAKAARRDEIASFLLNLVAIIKVLVENQEK